MNVTATVTDTPDDDDHPGIPEFLLRNADNTFKYPPTKKAALPNPAPSVSPPVPPVAEEDPFDKFKLPETPEALMKREADALWRAWVPSKEQPKRPRLSAMLKQVRKRWKDQGRI